MKRVLLSNKAAKEVNRMRDFIGSYEAVKVQIADAQCELANMLSAGRDEDSGISHFTDGIVSVMGLLADFNELVNNLRETRDYNPSHNGSDSNNEDDSNKYDYAPDEKELRTINTILEDENVDIPKFLQLDEMSFSEIAEAAGLTNENLHKKVCNMRYGKPRTFEG